VTGVLLYEDELGWWISTTHEGANVP
jgi:hypothetical protein